MELKVGILAYYNAGYEEDQRGLLLSVFLMHMFIQQVSRSTPNFTLGTNERLVIPRRVALTMCLSIGQNRSTYVHNEFYIGIRISHVTLYQRNSCHYDYFTSDIITLHTQDIVTIELVTK